MTDAPAKAKDPITYLVQLERNEDITDGDVVTRTWLDVGEVNVPPRTKVDGILEAAKDDLAPLLAAEPDRLLKVRVVPSAGIRETTVTLQTDPVLKVGA